MPRVERIRLGRRKVNLDIPDIVGQPLCVSYGGGTDSTYLLIMLRDLGIRPDAILHADVGSEKRNTEEYIPIMNAWCIANGFPEITVVKNNSKLYNSIHENMIRNRTMPSLAYGNKGCTFRWKIEVMNKWTNNWPTAGIAWSVGMQVLKVIGYDASPADKKRSKIKEDKKYAYWYPLRDAGITRSECIERIEQEGLPQPGKSACFFCPASKTHELFELYETEPHKLAIALYVEAHALKRTLDEKPGVQSTIGLGRNWNWRWFLWAAAPAILTDLDSRFDTAAETAKEVQAEIDKRSSVPGSKESKLVSKVWVYIGNKVDDYYAGVREEVSGGGF